MASQATVYWHYNKKRNRYWWTLVVYTRMLHKSKEFKTWLGCLNNYHSFRLALKFPAVQFCKGHLFGPTE